MQLLKMFHMVLAFALELALLAAFGYWGFHDKKTPEKYLFGLGAPVLVIIIWGIWAAPKSEHRLQQPFMMVLKLALFGTAAVGLHRAGQSGPAILLAVLAAITIVLEYLWY